MACRILFQAEDIIRPFQQYLILKILDRTRTDTSYEQMCLLQVLYIHVTMDLRAFHLICARCSGFIPKHSCARLTSSLFTRTRSRAHTGRSQGIIFCYLLLNLNCLKVVLKRCIFSHIQLCGQVYFQLYFSKQALLLFLSTFAYSISQSILLASVSGSAAMWCKYLRDSTQSFQRRGGTHTNFLGTRDSERPPKFKLLNTKSLQEYNFLLGLSMILY